MGGWEGNETRHVSHTHTPTPTHDTNDVMLYPSLKDPSWAVSELGSLLATYTQHKHLKPPSPENL